MARDEPSARSGMLWTFESHASLANRSLFPGCRILACEYTVVHTVSYVCDEVGVRSRFIRMYSYTVELVLFAINAYTIQWQFNIVFNLFASPSIEGQLQL